MKVEMHLLKNASMKHSRRNFISAATAVSFITLTLLCCVEAAKPKVIINKCCRIGDRLTSEKQCSAAAGSERWAPKIYMPAKGSYYNKTGQLPPFMKAEEEVLPACKNPQYFASTNNLVLMANGSLFLGEKHLMVDPENYCVEKDSALVCLEDHMGDPESLIEASIKVRKCCGPRQAYSEKTSSACANLDKNDSLYNSKIIENQRIDWSYSFPECSSSDFAIAGTFDQANFKPETGEIQIDAGKLLPQNKYCLDYVLGENKVVTILTCGEHYSSVPIAIPTKDMRFTIYATSLLISVVFLAATLAVGFLLLSNHHVLHWKCQTNYVLCLLIGDFLLAITQIAGNSLTGVFCYGIAVLMHFFFLAAFFFLNTMCLNIWWTFRDFRPTSMEKGKENFRLRVYQIYAWGFPTLIAIVAVILDNLPNTQEDAFLRPRFGEDKCWFYGDTEILTYFYGPIGILLCINIILFLSTARALTCGLWKRDDVKSTTERAALGKVCLKLVIVMGITWILDIVSWIAGPNYFWYATDIINALQGVFIFIVVACQPQVWAAFKRFWGSKTGNQMTNTTNAPQHSSSSHGLPSMDASVTNNTNTSKFPVETVC